MPPMAVIAIALTLALALIIGVLSGRVTSCLRAILGYLRGFPVDPDDVELPEYSGGNQVRLLSDGNEILPAALELVSQAEKVIRIQTMLLHPDEAGQAITRELVEAARRGVLVQLAFDWSQSAGGPVHLRHPRTLRKERKQQVAAMVAALRDAGGTVVDDKPGAGRHRRRPTGGGAQERRDRGTSFCLSANHVDHRKLMIVDDKVAIVGGANISREYLYGIPPDLSLPMDEEAKLRWGAGKPEAWEKWLDAAIQVEGPALGGLVELFSDRWEAIGGARVPMLGDPPSRGSVPVRVLSQEPGNEGIAASYLRMAGAAEREIYVVSPYVSYRPFLRLLAEAARRGVRVVLVFPGALNDVSISRDIFRALTRELVPSGVQIYENNRRMIHTKAMVIDRRWVHLGSFNCDYRSFVHDYELALLIDDVGLAEEVIHRLFERYLQEAELLQTPYAVSLTPVERLILPFT
jgi:cardiolipin synthase